MTAQELAAAGRALYGSNWRAELAHALGYADEALIVAVEAGKNPAPPEWRAKLIALAQDAALRAMDVASALIWREAEPAPEFAPRLV